MKLREEVYRKRKNITDVYEWDLVQWVGDQYRCPDLGIVVNIKTGFVDKEMHGEQVMLNKPFKSGSREITYRLVEDK